MTKAGIGSEHSVAFMGILRQIAAKAGNMLLDSSEVGERLRTSANDERMLDGKGRRSANEWATGRC